MLYMTYESIRGQTDARAAKQEGWLQSEGFRQQEELYPTSPFSDIFFTHHKPQRHMKTRLHLHVCMAERNSVF